MTRSIPKANDFVTFKHLVESIGPCAMAIEGLDERLTALEQALLPTSEAVPVSISLQNSGEVPEIL